MIQGDQTKAILVAVGDQPRRSRQAVMACAAFLAVTLVASVSRGQSNVVPLDLFASDGSRWFEFFSEVYAELGLVHVVPPPGGVGEPIPSDPVSGEPVPGTNDGFFNITAVFDEFDPDPPELDERQGAANVFVNDNDFSDSYEITLGATPAAVGIDVVPVIDFTANFNADIADTDAGESRYTTSVTNVSGTASFRDGGLTSLDFSADLTLAYDFTMSDLVFLRPYGVRAETGSIVFEGNRFDMLVADPGFEPDDPAEQLDANGNLVGPGLGDDDPFVDPVISTNFPPPDFAWVVFGIVENVQVVGDYNRDGIVDDGDYQLWASTFGQTVTAGEAADGNRNGRIDAGDYTVWRDNRPPTASAVPEPSALAIGSCLVMLHNRPRRYRPAATR